MRFRNGQWIDEHGFVVEQTAYAEHTKHRREIATAILAGFMASPESTIDIDGERLGEQRVRTAIALADTLLAELAKGG